MEKESKNPKHCPNCNKVLIKSISLLAMGSLLMRCPHCGKDVEIVMNHKTIMTIRVLGISLLLLLALLPIITVVMHFERVKPVLTIEPIIDDGK